MITHSDTEFRYTNAGQCSRDSSFTCPNPTCKLSEFKLQVGGIDIDNTYGDWYFNSSIRTFRSDECNVYLLNVYNKNLSTGKKERYYGALRPSRDSVNNWYLRSSNFANASPQLYFDKNKPLYICFIRKSINCQTGSKKWCGRNLIYKLSLYENIRNQIVEGETSTGNTLDLKINFRVMKPYSSEVQIYPIIPYFKSSSKQSSLKINGNSRSNFIRLNDENTQKSWSLYLLPDMYYREAAVLPSTNDWRSTKPIMHMKKNPDYKTDLMYSIRSNYESSRNKKKIYSISQIYFFSLSLPY